MMMMWHIVFAEPGRLPQSRAAKSHDHAIQRRASFLANPLMFAGFLNRTAGLSSGLR
jgi:hypothetical protein